MYISICGKKLELLSVVWSYYLIMIMGLSVAIPHIQMLSIILLVSATIAHVLKSGGRIKKTRVFPFVIWYVAFISFVLLSRNWSIRYWDSDIPGTCARIIIDILCMLVYIDSFDKAKDMAYKYVFAAVIMCLIFMLTSDPFTWGSDHVTCGITGMHRNNLGCIAAFSVILAMWLKERDQKAKYVKYSIPILICGSLFSGSRTSWVVILLALIMFSLLQENRSKRLNRFLLGILIVLVVGFILSSIDMSSSIAGKYLYRIVAIFNDSYTDSSMSYRSVLRLNAMQLFLKSPIIGNGLEATRAYNASIGLASISAHSNYFELLACYGIVGFVMYYSIYVSIIKKGFSQRKNNEGRKLALIVFVILAITEYQTFHEFDYTGVFLFMIVYAIAEYCPNNERRLLNE